MMNQEQMGEQVEREPNLRLPVAWQPVPIRHRLATRLTAILVSLVIVSTTVIGVRLIQTSRQAMEQSIVANNSQLAERTAAQVQQFVDNVVGILSLTTQMPGVLQMDPWQHSLILQNIISNDQFNLFRALYTISIEGNEIANTTGVSSGLWTEKAWFQRARRGSMYISPPFVRDKEILITIALPIQTFGEIIGVIGTDVSVENLQKIVEQTRLGEQGIIFVVTNEGQWIAHPNRTRLAKGEKVLDIQRFFAAGQRAGLYRDENGVEVLGAYSSVENAGWNVIVQQPLSEAYAPATRMTRQSVILIVVSMTIAIAIGLVFATRAIRPLQELVAGAVAVGAGNLQYTIRVKSRDEISILGQAFNAMTTQLRDLIGNLEQRVDERTADLAARSSELQEVNLQLELTARHSQRRAALLHASAEVSRAVTQIRDLDELLPQVTQLISHHFGYYHSGIFLIDRPSGYAVLRAANSSGGQQMLARHHKLRIGSEGIVGFVTKTGQPRIAHDVGIDAMHFKTHELPDTRSEMALPLHIGANIIGALDVQSTKEAAFEKEDVTVLTGLADQITIAIQNINLFQQTQAALAASEDIQQRYLRQEWDSYLGGRPKKPAASQFEPVSLHSPYGTLDRAEKRTEHETETNPAQS